MSCTPQNNGQSGGGVTPAEIAALQAQIDSLNANFVAPNGPIFTFDLQTNGTGYVNTPWITLPANGDAADIAAWLWGSDGAGRNFFHRWQQGGFGRNATAPGAAFPIVAQGGSVDPAAPAWSSGGNPPTWAADAFVVNGNNLEILLGSTDAIVVDWRMIALVRLTGTAARLL